MSKGLNKLNITQNEARSELPSYTYKMHRIYEYIAIFTFYSYL